MAQAGSRRRQRRRDIARPVDVDAYRLAFEHAPIGIAVHDPSGEIIAANRAMSDLLGREHVDLAGLLESVEEEERGLLHRQLQALLAGESAGLVGEHRLLRPDGTGVRVRLHATATLDPRGGIEALVTHAVDVTEQREHAQELLHQTLHDPLTKLPNRTLLIDRLGHALSRSVREESTVALLFLDLDYFKLVNDTLGHAAGDEILVEAAARLQAAVRPSDTVARFAGDEFVVCCEDVRRGTETIAMAERLLATMREAFVTGDQEVRLSTSVGIALGARPDQSPEELLRDADTALYVAKGEGRDRYEVYDDGIRSQLLARVETAAELRRAIEADELRLHFQPTFDLDHGTIVAVEALLRWEHPERGLLAPDAFLAVAGQVNLDVRIGEWVLRAAAAQARAWRDLVPYGTPPVWVNLSARQLTQSGFPERVAQTLSAYGLPADALGFEVRESVLTDVEPPGAGDVLGGLARIGCRVAIDDFGTAYSSLRALGRYHVDTIKIDRALVRGLPSSRTDAALVEHVISLGRMLDVVVSAEGVETEEQLRALTAAGCTTAAGYLLAPPGPASEVTARLEAHAAMTVTRFRVGDATLVRIPYIEIAVPAETVGLSADRVRVEAEAWADPAWTDGDQVRVAAAVWIVESDGKRIVIDPTSTADDILRGDEAVAHQEAVASLMAAAGYPRESVDVAIATHVDGLGMLGWRTDDGWEPFFPNAPLLVTQREAEFVLDESTFEPSGGGMFRALHEQGAVTTVGDSHSITGDVSTRWTGADGAGHQVLEIASRGERATFVGHLALNPVHCLIPEGQLHEDVEASYAELRTLADGRLLFGPLWPTPGAVRWTGDTVTTTDPIT